jgi:DNA-binding NarL/FixJ family response regulator
MTSILIADDHPLFREALKGALRHQHPDLEIRESANLEATLEQLEMNDEIDLLLLDLHMPGSADLYGLIRIREDYPHVPVAVISGTEDISTMSKVIGYGALGFISKSSSPDMIESAITKILDGDIWIPAHVRGKIKAISEEETSIAQKIADLTPQQYRVLCYLRDGLLNKQIAWELDISEATVKAHITAIFKKLNVSNRTQAVLVASKIQLDTVTEHP